MMMGDLDIEQVIELKTLVDKKIVNVKGLEKDSGAVSFYTDDGCHFVFTHLQDCYERVTLNDFEGSSEDLIGSTVLSAEEVSGECEPPEDLDIHDSYTWTFYKIETTKGGLWMRWYGESTGFYSKDVSFIWVNKPKN